MKTTDDSSIRLGSGNGMKGNVQIAPQDMALRMMADECCNEHQIFTLLIRVLFKLFHIISLDFIDNKNIV
jgi:hypothetical protein